MRRFEVNITPAERAGRVAVGLPAALFGPYLLASPGGTLAIALDASATSRGH